jgi:hypothetical protein
VEPTASPLAEQQQTKAIQSCGKAGLAVFQKRCVQLLDGSLERVLDDESSGDFVTLLLGKGDRLTQLSGGEDASAAISRQMPLLWRAIWIHQPAHLPEKVRFRIITADGRTCVSDPFEPASTTSEKPVALHCD